VKVNLFTSLLEYLGQSRGRTESSLPDVCTQEPGLDWESVLGWSQPRLSCSVWPTFHARSASV